MPTQSFTAAVLLVLVHAACGGGGGNGNAPDQRRELLVNLADAVVLPTLREFAAATPDLVTATTALCADPVAPTLATAQEAWREVRVPWKKTEALGFGPVSDLRLDRAIDFWPLRVTDVEEEIAQTAPVTTESVAALGASRKGLPVIEYLLWGDLARLHDGGVANRNCDYLIALAQVASDNAAQLRDAWEPDVGNFRDELVTAGSGSQTYSALAMPISESANAIFIAVELLEGEKLAEPLGKRNGGVARPDAVESPYSDNSIADLSNALTGVKNAYTGMSSSVSYASVVSSIDNALGTDVIARLDQCQSAIADIESPLSVAVQSSPATVEAAFDCTKELLRLFKTDVAGVLGVTPTFGDVDGD